MEPAESSQKMCLGSAEKFSDAGAAATGVCLQSTLDLCAVFCLRNYELFV